MTADDRHVILYTRHGYDWLNIIENIETKMEEGATAYEAIESTVNHKLNELQDIVTEHLRVPWPQQPGMGRSEFVPISAEVVNSSLEIWFGDRLAPLYPIIRITLQ